MRNYVVIGGSSGIGLALVKQLAASGATVWASYFKSEVPNLSAVNFFKYNVLEDSLHLEDFPTQIHGLVYCPGSIKLKPFRAFKEQDYIDDFNLQVMGATKVIRQLLPILQKTAPSAIVLFSTVAVQQGFKFHSQVAISKGAIEALTRTLAAELAPKVRVNAIAPSLTDTPLASSLLNSPQKKEAQAKINPLRKVGEADDVAAAAAFLLSEQASWVTGQIMHVDGGFSTIKM